MNEAGQGRESWNLLGKTKLGGLGHCACGWNQDDNSQGKIYLNLVDFWFYSWKKWEMPAIGVSIKCLEEMYLDIMPVLNVFPTLLFELDVSKLIVV